LMQICRAVEVLIWRCATHAARPTAATAAVTGPLLPDFQIRFNSRHPLLVSAAKHSGSKEQRANAQHRTPNVE
jgi:hypothetical protein